MGIKHYDFTEHPSGFVGFRVTRSFNNQYLQRYFSTVVADRQDSSDKYFRYQELRAQITDLQWELESLEYQYNRFVSEDHPTTKPFRGVGAHGLTLTFFKNRRGNWRAGFRVNRAHENRIATNSKYDRHTVTFDTLPYSEAWERAVRLWAEENQISEADVQRLLRQPPDPAQFKDLRRHMNEQEGCDIPVSAMSGLFREQREQLESRRLASAAKQAGRLTPPPKADNLDTELAIDMERWFAQEAEQGNAERLK